ncbi:MAG TPA: hypothetical protein VLB07_03190 [Woeseiaceae bacterium]|nr:hypothetical protein [Woeseiaceae bacterium]
MITEDTLLLYHYEELTSGEREQVRLALARDPRLAAEYRQLCDELGRWRDVPAAPVADHVRRRWVDAIDRAARNAPGKVVVRRTVPRFWLAGLGVAVAAAVAIGIAIGVRLQEQQDPGLSSDVPLAGIGNAAVTAVPASFTRGLLVHLEDSRREITGLPVTDEASRVALTLQLIEQNRLFEHAAEQSNAPNLARVLRAFEPILLRLAREDIAPQDAEALREQLAFELNVMLTKLSAAPSESAETI